MGLKIKHVDTIYYNDVEDTNALFELLGTTVFEKAYKEAVNSGVNFDNCTIEFIPKPKSINNMVKITPHYGSVVAMDWLKNIKFAYVECRGTVLFLESERDKEDEKRFIEELEKINYYRGYGTQELFGVIVFNDGTWFSRWEYDGSEGWEFNQIPSEETCKKNFPEIYGKMDKN